MGRRRGVAQREGTIHGLNCRRHDAGPPQSPRGPASPPSLPAGWPGPAARRRPIGRQTHRATRPARRWLTAPRPRGAGGPGRPHLALPAGVARADPVSEGRCGAPAAVESRGWAPPAAWLPARPRPPAARRPPAVQPSPALSGVAPSRDGARAARRRSAAPDGSRGALALAALARRSVRVPLTGRGDSSRGLAARHRPLPGAHVALARGMVGWPLPPVMGAPHRRVLPARLTARESSGHAHFLRWSDPPSAACTRGRSRVHRRSVERLTGVGTPEASPAPRPPGWCAAAFPGGRAGRLLRDGSIAGRCIPVPGIPAYGLPGDASPGTLPSPTQDSVPACWLGFVRVAISDDWTFCACKAQLPPHRTDGSRLRRFTWTAPCPAVDRGDSRVPTQPVPDY